MRRRGEGQGLKVTITLSIPDIVSVSASRVMDMLTASPGLVLSKEGVGRKERRKSKRRVKRRERRRGRRKVTSIDYP